MYNNIFLSNRTYTFDRAWLYSVNPILYLTCFVFTQVTTSLCRRLWAVILQVYH